MGDLTVPPRPRFRRHLRAEVGGEGVYLFGEHGVTAVRGSQVAALATLLDGRHDLDELVRARPGGMDAAQVKTSLDLLVAADLVVYTAAADEERDRVLAWWDGCGVDASGPREPCRVGLTVVGEGVDAGPLRAALAGTDVEVTEPDLAELGVVLCGDYLDPGLAAVDAAHRAAGRPWLLAKIDGARTWIGPVFRPSGGCWHCLAHRMWSHRHAEAVVQRTLGRTGPAPRAPMAMPPVTAAAAQLVALEAGKWSMGHRYAGQDSVWIFDTHELMGDRHQFRARPQCPSCGDPTLVADRAMRPVRLAPTPKSSTGGGGDRAFGAAETLARYRHLVSPVTGIVKRVAPDPNAPPGAHAYRSGVNLSRSVMGLEALRRGLRVENGGKGFTAVEAEVGALCEAAERFSATWQGDEMQVRGSLHSLGKRAVDPRTCLLFDERQFADREAWNRDHSPFNRVPERFDPDAELDWTPLWSLPDGGHRLLPTGMLYFGAPPRPGFYADSNGCAAGSSIADAVLQGTLELVERDAVAIWWYNRLVVPEVDLDGFGDQRIAEQRELHAGLGRRVHVLDVTSDLGVPTMVAVSRRVDNQAERILFGCGAHLDPATALRRALSEVNQMLSADGVVPAASDDPDWHRWATGATLANQPYLRPDGRSRPRTRADYPVVRRTDVRDDVLALAALFAERGMSTLVLDQTRPDVGLPVVKVVVPGLRTFWSRYAPGRLFDVPVHTGQLSRRTPYAELNPQPFFL